MTDTTELAQSLKAAAEKATQGNWRAFQYHDGRCGIGGGHNAEIMVCEHISKERPHDAMFIALANPANILALVEALEKAQQRIGKLEKKLTDHKRMNQEMAKAMLTPNDSDAAEMEIAALRQRIAGLESRTVKLPLPSCTYADHSYPAYTKQQVLTMLESLGVTVVEEDV
ncbi:ead/Ea22-like family protein [Klebsiella pneumoniae]